MKSFARFLFVCLLFVSGVCALAAEGAYVTNTPVELTGTFGVGVGLDANDKKEYYYYLKLDRPIVVQDNEYGENEANVRKIQLALPFEFFTKTYV